MRSWCRIRFIFPMRIFQRSPRQRSKDISFWKRNDYQIDIEEVESLITDRTKMMVIVSSQQSDRRSPDQGQP